MRTCVTDASALFTIQLIVVVPVIFYFSTYLSCSLYKCECCTVNMFISLSYIRKHFKMVHVELYSYGRSVGKPAGPWHRTWNCERLPNASRKLRSTHTGLHKRLRSVVLSSPDAERMLKKAKAEIKAAVAQAGTNETLRFAFGCYAGKHRSVSIVEALAPEIHKVAHVKVCHRHVHRKAEDYPSRKKKRRQDRDAKKNRIRT